jgi:protein TonB
MSANLLFAQPRQRLAPALGCSLAAHAAVLLIALLLVRSAAAPLARSDLVRAALPDVVWLNQPGPGGGGGGGGNRMSAPIRKVEVRGTDRVSMPAVPPPAVQPAPTTPPADAPPLGQHLEVPIQFAGSVPDVQPGTLDGTATSGSSLGPGSGGGAGAGRGTGMGNGTGSGLGDGWGGGTGGSYYRQGSGIEDPVPVREVKPNYTNDAMRMRIRGTAVLECIVLADGTVGPVRILRSLDHTFGLDEEAIKAAKQWRFRPARRQGQPVAILITIAMDFNMQ